MNEIVKHHEKLYGVVPTERVFLKLIEEVGEAWEAAEAWIENKGTHMEEVSARAFYVERCDVHTVLDVCEYRIGESLDRTSVSKDFQLLPYLTATKLFRIAQNAVKAMEGREQWDMAALNWVYDAFMLSEVKADADARFLQR